MWYGDIAAIPATWALCNGENGTPNLLDKFVVGAGSSYAIGDIGGYLDACLPSHSHSGSTAEAGYHGHGVTDPGHTHPFNYGPYNLDVGGSGSIAQIGDMGVIGVASTGISINGDGAHTHGMALDAAGEDPAGRNLPPFVALAYIMKIA